MTRQPEEQGHLPANDCLPPLTITVAVNRVTGLLGVQNSIHPSRQLEDCRLLIEALQQVLGALHNRRVELEVAAAVACKEGEGLRQGE